MFVIRSYEKRVICYVIVYSSIFRGAKHVHSATTHYAMHFRDKKKNKPNVNLHFSFSHINLCHRVFSNNPPLSFPHAISISIKHVWIICNNDAQTIIERLRINVECSSNPTTSPKENNEIYLENFIMKKKPKKKKVSYSLLQPFIKKSITTPPPLPDCCNFYDGRALNLLDTGKIILKM